MTHMSAASCWESTAREEADPATTFGAKELARRRAVKLQASETALAAQANKTSLEREVVTASLVIAKYLSGVATARTAFEAMTRADDGQGQRARTGDGRASGDEGAARARDCSGEAAAWFGDCDRGSKAATCQ